jgi:glycosyltransferase involved in cell wall biosynthesis
MKILIVIDKYKTAIDRLAQSVKKYSPHLDIEILAIHPKRPDVESLHKAVELMEWCDILDVHYWKSGEVLRKNFTKLFKAKSRILFHMNPYDADREEVNKAYDLVVVGNSEIQSRVPFAYLVPYGVDLKTFEFSDDYTEDKVVNMTVARIEGKKGVREVAQVCKELGYKLKLVGRISKSGYMDEIRKAGGDVLEFYENVTDEKMIEIYKQSAIHVCNSVNDFESGTLPILESMALGIPVLTRNVGHVPDIYDGKNMVVRTGEQNDIEDLKKNLKDLMENRDWRLKLRQKARDAIRARDIRKMVFYIRKLYNKLYIPDEALHSIIIPVRDSPKAFVECLVGALSQTYKKYEIVVADSGDVPVKQIIEEARKKTNIPIKYIHFPHKDNYTLAEARNRAIIEAEGEWLLFCDSRLKINPDVLEIFNFQKKFRCWSWGVKDGTLKGFVENFSHVNRKDLIGGGMFSERMQWYGGMTQEIRTRFEKERGFHFVLCTEANAKEVMSSKSKWSKKKDAIEAKWTIVKMYG